MLEEIGKSDQVLGIINKLCSKFADLASKLQEVRSKSQILEETAEEAKHAQKMVIEGKTKEIEATLLRIHEVETELNLPQDLRVDSAFLQSVKANSGYETDQSNTNQTEKIKKQGRVIELKNLLEELAQLSTSNRTTMWQLKDEKALSVTSGNSQDREDQEYKSHQFQKYISSHQKRKVIDDYQGQSGSNLQQRAEIDHINQNDDVLAHLRKKLESLELAKEESLLQLEELNSAISKVSSKMKNEVFQNTIQLEGMITTKSEYRKMMDKTLKFGQKIKNLELSLAKNLANIDKKQERFEVLRQINKRLKQNQKTKLDIKQRWESVANESLELQYQISEAMKSLADRFNIQATEVESNRKKNALNTQRAVSISEGKIQQSLESQELERILRNQEEYIKSLEKVTQNRENELLSIQQRTIELKSNIQIFLP